MGLRRYLMQLRIWIKAYTCIVVALFFIIFKKHKAGIIIAWFKDMKHVSAYLICDVIT